MTISAFQLGISCIFRFTKVSISVSTFGWSSFSWRPSETSKVMVSYHNCWLASLVNCTSFPISSGQSFVRFRDPVFYYFLAAGTRFIFEMKEEGKKRTKAAMIWTKVQTGLPLWFHSMQDAQCLKKSLVSWSMSV